MRNGRFCSPVIFFYLLKNLPKTSVLEKNQYLVTSVRSWLNFNVLRKDAAWNSWLPVEVAVCESATTPRIWVSLRLVSAEALKDGQSLLGFHCFRVASVQIQELTSTEQNLK